jgi:hypothetical protein
VLGWRDINPATVDELATSLSQVPLYSVVGAGRMGDRDETFMDFGTSPENVAAFRDIVPIMQNTAGRTAEALREVAALKRLDDLRGLLAPTLAPIPPEWGDAAISVYGRGYLLMALMSEMHAVRMIASIQGRNETAQRRTQLFTALQRVDLSVVTSADIDACYRAAAEMWDETRNAAGRLDEARAKLSEALLEAWSQGIAPELRPTIGDGAPEIAAKARALRTSGRNDHAIAVWLAYAVVQQPSDPDAVDHAETAISFTRGAGAVGVPVHGGGLLIVGARDGTDDWNAGLQNGVVLLAYDGKAVTSAQDLEAAMKAAPGGQKVRLTIAFRDESGNWKKRVTLRGGNAPIEATLLPI